jgi:RNA polymerase sigma-70 factor (ECF subfamily)
MLSFPEPAMPEILVGPAESAKATAVYADWSDLVARIQSGETDGLEELYNLFSSGMRFYLVHQFGADEVDERIHDTFMIVVQAIQRGELREPERLMGFVRTIVRRQVAAHIDRVAYKPPTQSAGEAEFRRENPEEAVAFQRRTELIHRVLATLSERDREILTRFYVLGQSTDEICSTMGLTETQFRLLKSRAKGRFEDLSRKKRLTGSKLHHQPEQASDSSRSPDAGEVQPGNVAKVDADRILPIVAHAVAVFGDEKKASHWLATPLPILDNRSPSQLLEAQEGVDLVEQVLTRIEHNIPS